MGMHSAVADACQPAASIDDQTGYTSPHATDPMAPDGDVIHGIVAALGVSAIIWAMVALINAVI